MHKLGLNITQDAGIVRNQHNTHIIFLVSTVHAGRHDFKSINVKAGVSFIKNTELGLQKLQLQNLMTFLLTAGETFIDVTSNERRINVQMVHSFFNVFGPGS